MLKVYGIHGRTTAVIQIPIDKAGRAYLECEFGRGRMGAGPANRPATYATRDETKQAIIENSPLFASGKIKLVRAYEEEKPVKAKTGAAPRSKAAAGITPPAPKPEPLGPVEGVTSREEAVEYLKAHEAKATNLKDDESIKSYMAKIGVTFPNLEL